MKHDFLFSIICMSVNMDWMKAYAIINQNGITACVIVNVIRLDECVDIKNCSCKKRLFGKLELSCEISFADKKVKCQENNCLICTI